MQVSELACMPGKTRTDEYTGRTAGSFRKQDYEAGGTDGQKGLVTKHRSAQDRRSWNVGISTQGLDANMNVSAVSMEVQSELMANLPEEEREAIYRCVKTYIETIPGDSSIVIEEMSAWGKQVPGTNLQSKDVYSIQWIPGTEVHKFNLPSDGRYDLYYKFEDGEFADIGTPALQRTETMVSHLE